MAEVRRLLRRQDCAELPLHLFRLLAGGQPQQIADADAVRVADDAARLAVEVAEQKIGRLAATAGQPQQILHLVRHLSAVLVPQHLTGEDDVPRLVLVEAA